MSNKGPKFHPDGPRFQVNGSRVQREATKDRTKSRWRVENPKNVVYLTHSEVEDLADALDEGLAWSEEEHQQKRQGWRAHRLDDSERNSA